MSYCSQVIRLHAWPGEFSHNLISIRIVCEHNNNYNIIININDYACTDYNKYIIINMI